MSLYQWLLALHVSAAFILAAGTVVAGTFRVLAQRRERPSEVALFLGLTRVAVALISIGVLATLVFGLWLVQEADYSWGEAWIWLAIVLWVVLNAAGGIGGRREREVRELAQRLAAEGDAPSEELRAGLNDPVALTLDLLSVLGVVVILALMIWKPGS
jgi:uncharacterized membrane protein